MEKLTGCAEVVDELELVGEGELELVVDGVAGTPLDGGSACTVEVTTTVFGVCAETPPAWVDPHPESTRATPAPAGTIN